MTNEILIELEMFEVLLDCSMLPDRRLLRELLNSGEPGSVQLESTYGFIEQGDMDRTILANLDAIKDLAFANDRDGERLSSQSRFDFARLTV